MNKVNKKILSSALATLCMFEMSGTKSKSFDPAVLAPLGMLIAMPLAFGFPMLIKYMTQQSSDNEAYSHVQGSNFFFSNINTKRVCEEFANLIAEYPWAENEINVIKDYILGVIALKKINPNAPTMVLNLLGNPGCGKTSMVKKIFNIMNIKRPVSIYLSNMDSKNEKISVADQLFGSWTSGHPYMEIVKYSPLAIALKKNTGNTALLLDDVDKYPADVVQKLYTVCDGGTIKTGDSYIDTSKLFAIMTGNTDFIDVGEHSKEWKDSMNRRTITIQIPDPRKIDYISKMKKELEIINRNNKQGVNISYDENTLDKLATKYSENGRNMTNISEFRIRTLGQINELTLNNQFKLKLSVDLHGQSRLISANNNLPSVEPLLDNVIPAR